MWNHYLSKINVRFFKDDGSPDVETAESVYDELQEIQEFIGADYEGMSVKDGLITSNGYFYDDSVGACMTLVDCYAKNANYKGLYYVLEEGEKVGTLCPFCSEKKPGSIGYLIREIVAEDDGQLLKSKTFDIDENGNETLEDYSFVDNDCTEIYPKKWDLYKQGYPVGHVPEGIEFYSMKLSDFKNVLIKLGLNTSHFTTWPFGDIKINIYKNLATFIIDDHYVQIKTEDIPDMRLYLSIGYFFYILENASNNGYISFAHINNKELSTEYKTIQNVFFKFDDRLISGTAVLGEPENISLQEIKENRYSFICNKTDLLNALEDIYKISTPKYVMCYIGCLDDSPVNFTANFKEQELSILLEDNAKYPLLDDIKEERKIKIQNLSNKEESLSFKFRLQAIKSLSKLSAQSIVLFVGNKSDNIYNTVIEPLPTSELMDFFIIR